MILSEKSEKPIQLTSPRYAGMIRIRDRIFEAVETSPRYAGMIL